MPRQIPNNGRSVLRKIPHIGWNALQYPAANRNWDQSILGKIEEGDSFYFVHSFMAAPENPETRIADCLYGGNRISAAIGYGNVVGCQFHPEKSGEVGLRILGVFLSESVCISRKR